MPIVWLFQLKCWICWSMLDPPLQEFAAFCWDAEYVEYVMWAMGPYGEPTWIDIFNMSAEKEPILRRIPSLQQKYTTCTKLILWAGMIHHARNNDSFGRTIQHTQTKLLSPEKMQHICKSWLFELKCWICWIMLDQPLRKLASFS